MFIIFGGYIYIYTHKSKYVWLVAAVLYHSIFNFTMYTFYIIIIYYTFIEMYFYWINIWLITVESEV